MYSELADDRPNKIWVEERKNWSFLNPISMEQVGVNSSGLRQYKICTKKAVCDKLVEKYELYEKSTALRLCTAAYGVTQAVQQV